MFLFYQRWGTYYLRFYKKWGEDCPPAVDRAKYGNRYIWPLYASYDIFVADTNGKNEEQITHSEGYDAEATLSYDGKK